MPITLRELCRETRAQLEQADIHNAELVTRTLVKHALDLDDSVLIVDGERELSDSQITTVNDLVEKRLSGMPVSRIMGEREFWGLSFKVNDHVLDPRPDTETIIDVACKYFKDNPPRKILDLGTGSGCLITTLLHIWKDAEGVAVDLSEEALKIAAYNAEKNQVYDRVRFVQGFWCDSIQDSFDLIVANPPYIPTQDIATLSPEVKNHDPFMALDGGEDGFDDFIYIIKSIKKLMHRESLVLIEIGYDQSEKAMRLVKDSNLSVRGVHADMAGIPRVVDISFGEK